MPELPEVETTRRGIAPHLEGALLQGATVRQPRLRWPVPDDLSAVIAGERIAAVRRRAKYLLVDTAPGSVILHLGMSGSLRIVDAARTPGPHDHVDLLFGAGRALRLTDPRRFGAVLWVAGDPLHHPLLSALGPEPLGPDFHGEVLHRAAAGRSAPVKHLIMDAGVVVGVGNIYASEALWRAGIHPRRPARRIALTRYRALAQAIRDVLADAIAAGGTTLRDFVDEAGQPGYFSRQLAVYDREGQPCPRCAAPIRRAVLGQRSTYYCPRCQR